ncbi:MAG: sortase [Candidatus Gracilibacteria bacterium]
MTNTKFENIDILRELEASFETKQNIIDTEEIIESFDYSYKTEQNDFNISTENIIESLDFPSEENIETINIENKNFEKIDISENINENKYIIVKKKNSFVSSILFITKYILTSSLIFAVLIVTANYSAYINIAKSYIFKSEMQAITQKLITSVEASSIKEKYSEEKIIEIEQSEETEKLSIKQMIKEQDKQNVNLNIEITPYDNRVVIPKIGQNIPLLDIKNRKVNGENELNDIFMEELENGIVRYPGSSKPGEDGISFIFGHSSNFPWIKGDFNDVFSLLDNVEFGDEIIIYYDQKKYVYKIREKSVITPGDVSVLERNRQKSEITLMTCWPIGTTLNRLIVTGELIEVN